MSSRKRLIVNADDFGFTPDVNEGIVEAHRRGILTATTLMANGDAFEDALQRARAAPSLDIGGHLVLVGGVSLLSGKAFPRTVGRLLVALARRQIRPYEEIRAQVKRIVDAGIKPTHLDTHKHTHVAPAVLEAVVRVSEEFGIGWVRRPFDFPLHASVPPILRLTNRSIGLLRRRFHRVLAQHQCRTTDHFAGFQYTGRLRTAELVELLRLLPEGTTELMCHPGKCGPALRGAHTRLKESREAELEALTADEVKTALARSGIELANYRQL
ncbi:MAG TPA: ChbG/HpnK family deacetylase [Bryobacteraceae bacterium]|nr:ChbG/HpnK family deacetylase [Bryobacteraceae bacterium]